MIEDYFLVDENTIAGGFFLVFFAKFFFSVLVEAFENGSQYEMQQQEVDDDEVAGKVDKTNDLVLAVPVLVILAYQVHDLGPLVLSHNDEVCDEGSHDVVEARDAVVELRSQRKGFYVAVLIEKRAAHRTLRTAVVVAAVVVGIVRVDRPIRSIDWLGGGSDDERLPASVGVRCPEELHAHDRISEEDREETSHDDDQSW